MRALIFRQSVAVLLAGLAIGIPLSIASARLYGALLFQVRTADPAIFLVVALVLTGVVAAASWFPAQRAAEIDPVTSLRSE